MVFEEHVSVCISDRVLSPNTCASGLSSEYDFGSRLSGDAAWPPCSKHTQKLPDRPCGELDAIAHRHLMEIESRMKRLKALKAEVSRMITQCANGSVADCRIIDVLAHHEHGLNDEH